MGSERVMSTTPLRIARAAGGVGTCLLAALLLCACAPLDDSRPGPAELPPLHYRGADITRADAAALAPTPDLLAVDADMRRFVARAIAGAHSRRQRLELLHAAVTGSASLGMQYDPLAEGSARDAYYSHRANCLAFANLFVAMAREAGLDARYQWLLTHPQWTRVGEQVAVRLHVNVIVYLNSRDRYMVDLDPLPPRAIASTREISDTDVQALYHSNLAMNALADEQLDLAWAHALRALELSPDMSHLWVNLGVVYRHAGQYDAAEQAYRAALEVDEGDSSALNNLIVLYGMEGREAERDSLLGQVERHRERNPYYHAWLGDMAAQEGDWSAAREHYEEALDLAPDDASLLYGLGVIHEHLGQRKAALRYLQEAMDHAVLSTERATYRAAWEALQADDMVSR